MVLENSEVIDPARPQVLIVNHSSWFDVLALATFLPGAYRFVGAISEARVFNGVALTRYPRL